MRSSRRSNITILQGSALRSLRAGCGPQQICGWDDTLINQSEVSLILDKCILFISYLSLSRVNIILCQLNHVSGYAILSSNGYFTIQSKPGRRTRT